MLKIYTASIANAKKNNLIHDPRFLDITVKSGDKVFAPTWEMVMAYKDSKMSSEKYTEKYLQLMRASYKKNKQRWKQLLAKEEVILACYCKADHFCHRYILSDILYKCGAIHVDEIR